MIIKQQTKEQELYMLYFAHSRMLYDHPLETKAIYDIHRILKPKELVDPNSLFKKLKEEGKTDLNEISKREYFKKSLSYCDSIVYINTFTDKGNPTFTDGVFDELSDSLWRKLKIYRIYLTDTGNINTTKIERIAEINQQTIQNEMVEKYKRYTSESQNWSLKTIKDYIKLHENNPEIRDFMKNQCYDPEIEKIGAVHGILPWISNLWMTNDRQEIKLQKCLCGLDNNRHAYIDPKSQIHIVHCPYMSTGWQDHPTSFTKVRKFPTEDIIQIAAQNRTIHKFMVLFDKSVHEFGTCLRHPDTNIPILDRDRKFILNPRLIIGAQPVIDIDILSDVKGSGKNFFTKEIFEEYRKSIYLLVSYLDMKDILIMFSGNGIYIILPVISFKQRNINYKIFDDTWRTTTKDMQKILDANKIKYLQIEEGYGWNRYFKLSGTPHASKERIAIPINKDKFLDYTIDSKYIDENSKINDYLNGEIKFTDTIKESNWR